MNVGSRSVRSRRGDFPVAPGLVAGLGLAALLLGAASRVGDAASPGPDAAGIVRLPPGAALGEDAARSLPGGVRRLLGNLAWLAAVQHYGRTRLAGGEAFPQLAPLVRQAVRFDPDLRPAAIEGALLVAESPPLGAGAPKTASALLADWTARHPRDWEARLLAGLVRHWHHGDPAGAAAMFAAAAREPGAPRWFTALAGRSLAEAGARDAARRLWRAVEASALSRRARANAATHLMQLDALDRRDVLAVAVGRFADAFGRFPTEWAEVVDAGFLEETPRDPAGVPFRIAADGAVRIAPGSPLAGIPGPGRP